MTHKAMVTYETVRALEEIASMADWQTGVPVDTEAANEHAMIAQRMADVARSALAQAETQPVARAWEGATGMRGLMWDEPKREAGVVEEVVEALLRAKDDLDDRGSTDPLHYINCAIEALSTSSTPADGDTL